jgi:proteasome lid subunit RPN8/RPN11
MSGIDVHDLAQDNLPAGRFPVSPRADFRLFLAPEVHRGTWEHAKKDLSIEICGVLVGHWERDDDGPYANVTDFICCEHASSKFAEVTFTHDSWAQINREMDTRFADLRIIGWYHSHPDFGIFLSERDCFIQQHFFSGAGQIAYVIDPVRDLEGVFVWREGKPTPLQHYWVGESVRTVEAGRQAAADRSGRAQQPAAAAESAGRMPPRRQSLDLAMTLLSWLALFLLGYLFSGMHTRWEQEMIVEGTVAHYGFSKLMKIGLEDNLAKVRAELLNLADALDRLPDATAALPEDEAEAAAKQRKLIADRLAICERALGEIQQLYGLSEVERKALLNLIVHKQEELRRPPEPPTRPPKLPSAAEDDARQSEDEPGDAAAKSSAVQNEPPVDDAETQPVRQ